MIRLTCTHCQNVLEMDDAFAGGVCRCQHCGTIQTVPSHLKDAPASGVYPKPSVSKSLYKGGRPGGTGTATGSGPSGLDNLADAVATSSGLSSGNLAGQSNRGSAAGAGVGALAYQTPTPTPKKGNGLVIGLFVGIGVLVLVVGLLVAFLLLSGSTKTVNVPATPGGSDGSGSTGTPVVTPSVKVTSGPNFCGVGLSAGKIVYILDRGDSSKNVFDPLKAALYKSLASLGADREFQVLFWKRGGDKNLDEGSYPVNKTAKATPQELSAVEKKFEDLVASGATEVDSAMKAAMLRSPGEIVLVTAKGVQLDDSMVASVLKTRGSSNVKIHTVGLGGGTNKVLKSIAEKTGGTYTEMSESELRNQ